MSRGRKRTGTIEWHVDHWDVRPTLSDGSRGERVCQPPAPSKEASMKAAKGKAKALTELAAKLGTTRANGHAVSIPAGPTMEEWCDAWCGDRQRRGLTSVDDDRGRLGKWVFPRLSPPLGERPMTAITPDDLGLLVEDIDARVLAGELRWKTAHNVWGLISKMFDDARRSKSSALRVRADNPAKDVRGPDDGTKRSKVYLYPSEFLAVVSCPRVPIRWRRLFALQTYLYTRVGELEALGVEDVDIDRGIVHVHRSIERREKCMKETKSNSPRRFTVEREVCCLLQRVHEEARAEARARLVRMPPRCDLAVRLRQYLKWAGVTRAELFTNDATRKQITLHDLRATGITWMAIRGDEPQRIMHRAGHADFKTTQEYIREAEALEYLREEVFPPLPPELYQPDFPPEGPGHWAKLSGRIKKNSRPQRDLNPVLSGISAEIGKHGHDFQGPNASVSARNENGRAETGRELEDHSVGDPEGDPEGAQALALVGRSLLATSLIWDLTEESVAQIGGEWWLDEEGAGGR